MPLGDRIAVERRVDGLEARIDQRDREYTEQRRIFYDTHWGPLVSMRQRWNAVLWLTFGVALAALLAALTSIVVHIVR